MINYIPFGPFERKPTFRRVMFVTCAVLLSIVAAATTVQAQSRKAHATKLASTAERAIVDDATARYICSPSGFGHLSTCTVRVDRLSGG